jgi:hypothetical protein
MLIYVLSWRTKSKSVFSACFSFSLSFSLRFGGRHCRNLAGPTGQKAETARFTLLFYRGRRIPVVALRLFHSLAANNECFAFVIQFVITERVSVWSSQ